MNTIFQAMHPVLSFAPAYKFAMRMLGGHSARLTHVREHIRPQPGDRILDIGCGPGDILDYLPDIEYVGVDIDAGYIEHARSRYGHLGRFICKNVTDLDPEEMGEFDIIIATGILPHLDDFEALRMLELGRQFLKGNGRLITYDGCFHDNGQHPFDRWMLNGDRGKYVRTLPEYLALTGRVFPQVRHHLRSDLLRVPYSLLIMECGLKEIPGCGDETGAA